MRIDAKSGVVTVTSLPDERQEFLILPHKKKKLLYVDKVPNPKSRVSFDGYTMSCTKDGLSVCTNLGNVEWRKLASGITIKKSESLVLDRFGCLKYSKNKIMLYKFPKII